MSGALFRNYVASSLYSLWRSSQTNEPYFSGAQNVEDLSKLKNISGQIL